MKELVKLYRKNGEILNYIIAGGLTTFVSMFLFWGCVIFFLDGNNRLQLQMANVISWSGAVLFAYLVNRKYVFKSRNKKVVREIVSFISSRVITLLLDIGTMYFLVFVFGINYNIAKMISSVITMTGNYCLSKVIVFANRGKE